MTEVYWHQERRNWKDIPPPICEVEGCDGDGDFVLRGPGVNEGLAWACKKGGMPAYTNGKFNKASHRYIVTSQYIQRLLITQQQRVQQKSTKTVFGQNPELPRSVSD